MAQTYHMGFVVDRVKERNYGIITYLTESLSGKSGEYLTIGSYLVDNTSYASICERVPEKHLSIPETITRCPYQTWGAFCEDYKGEGEEMRTIKFRAWDKRLKRMTYSQQAELNNPFDFWAGYDKYQFAWMQYTGLKDKNGKEICEGDIVQDTIPSWRWEIYFDNDEARFWCKNDKTKEGVLGQWNASDDPAYPEWNKYEVIGNIYENLELLK